MQTIYIRKMRYEVAKQKFLDEINKAFTKGIKTIAVIHGIGEYKLHDMIRTEIEKIDYVELYEGGLENNPGITKLSILTLDENILNQYIE